MNHLGNTHIAVLYAHMQGLLSQFPYCQFASERNICSEPVHQNSRSPSHCILATNAGLSFLPQPPQVCCSTVLPFPLFPLCSVTYKDLLQPCHTKYCQFCLVFIPPTPAPGQGTQCCHSSAASPSCSVHVPHFPAAVVTVPLTMGNPGTRGRGGCHRASFYCCKSLICRPNET